MALVKRRLLSQSEFELSSNKPLHFLPQLAAHSRFLDSMGNVSSCCESCCRFLLRLGSSNYLPSVALQSMGAGRNLMNHCYLKTNERLWQIFFST